jgi:predicted DNA-binding protein
MGKQVETAPRRGPGRPRSTGPRKRPTSGEPIKPTASGQLEQEENDEMNAICDAVNRSRSYFVRAAILHFINEHKAGRIDWTLAPGGMGKL